MASGLWSEECWQLGGEGGEASSQLGPCLDGVSDCRPGAADLMATPSFHRPLLAPFSSPFWASWEPLGALPEGLGACLGGPWSLLGVPEGLLGASWAPWEGLGGPLEGFSKISWAPWGALEGFLGHLRGVWEASWRVWGASWDPLGGIWGCFGEVFGVVHDEVVPMSNFNRICIDFRIVFDVDLLLFLILF